MNLISPTGTVFHLVAGTVVATKATELLKFEGRDRPSFVTFDTISVTNLGPPAPEVDPQSGASAVALALGGLMLMTDRRQRRPS